MECAISMIKCEPVLKFRMEVVRLRLVGLPFYNLLIGSVKPGEFFVVIRQIGDLKTHIAAGDREHRMF